MSWMVSLIVKALQKALVDQKLNTIIGLLEEAQGKENKIMATIAELEQQIRESVAVEQSAVLLIQALKNAWTRLALIPSNWIS